MARWTIYYRSHSVSGETLEDWLSAPDDGVQVVVVYAPYPDVDGHPFRPWAGVDDRMLWTGTDDYEINGWPRKLGLLIPYEEYLAIWETACGR